MRKKEEIIKEFKKESEKQGEKAAIVRLQLEVLIDIRDALSGKVKVSQDRNHEETVETKAYVHGEEVLKPKSESKSK